MLRVAFAALLGVSLLSLAAVGQQPPKGKGPPPADKSKEKPADKSKGDSKAPPAGKAGPKEIVGLFKSRNVAKKTITLSVEGTDVTFSIDDSTKIVGPRGGQSEKGIEDDRLSKGYTITIVPSVKDSAIAAQVKLPYRNDKVEDKSKGADKGKKKQ